MGDAPARQASLTMLVQTCISALSRGQLPSQDIIAKLISKVRGRDPATAPHPHGGIDACRVWQLLPSKLLLHGTRIDESVML